MVHGLSGVVHAIGRHLIEMGIRRPDPTKGGAARRPLTEADVFDVMVEHGDISDEAVAALASEDADDVSRQTAARRRLAAIEILQRAPADEFGPAGEQARIAALAILRKRPTCPPSAVDGPVDEPELVEEAVPGLAELQRALADAASARGRPSPIGPHHIARAQLALERRRVPATDAALQRWLAGEGVDVSVDAVRRRRRWLTRHWPEVGGRPLLEWLAVEGEDWLQTRI